MARIGLPDNLLLGLASQTLQEKKTNKKKETSKTNSFESILEESIREETDFVSSPVNFDAKIAADLLDDVHSKGESLKVDQSFENIQAYKSAVRSFVHYVVSNAYDVDEKKSSIFVKKEKRKSFTNVVVIDQKLEQLAAGILLKQSNNLEILSRLDELTGLLVDLLQ